MTAPDIDVRAAGPPAAESARAPGPSRLARLLLLIARPFSKLDRRFLLLLFTAALSPACIIPVAPEFQDPAGRPNGAPRIVDADPFFGTEVPAVDRTTFSIKVTDPDNDRLFIKWIADFPPFTDTLTRLIPPQMGMVPPSADGTPQQIDQVIFCDAVRNGLSHHHIMVVVADRDFAFVQNNPLAVTDNGLTAIQNWFLNLTCQASPQ